MVVIRHPNEMVNEVVRPLSLKKTNYSNPETGEAEEVQV